MPSRRTAHAVQRQLPLDLRPRRASRRRGRGRGGARPGAGRPRIGRGSAPHRRRPTLRRHTPVHVVLRVVRDIGSLRRRRMYRALREASLTVALRELYDRPGNAFRIIHISIQATHIHLLVEADHKHALSNGLQRFQISAAKRLNAAASAHRSERRRGTVFPDRFHQEILESPTRARHALAYVLNNWRKHGEDRHPPRRWNVDPYSTGLLFDGWREHDDAARTLLWRWPAPYLPLVVHRPRSWLLRIGWRRARQPISFRDRPPTRALGRAR